jgi:predicted O-methyltransferase YrrM
VKYDNILETVRTTWVSRIILSAIELEIPDHLEKAPLSAEQVAQGLDLNLRATELLLNALCGIGLLNKENGLYKNTDETSDRFVTTSKNYGGNALRHYNQLWKTWSDLTTCVKSGRPSPVSGYTNESEYEAFVSAMDDYAFQRANQLATQLKINEDKPFLDLGGGPGTYSIAFCKSYSRLRSWIFDRPVAIKIAKANTRKYGLESQVDFIEGDFLKDPVTGTYGTVWASHIIHAYGEQNNIELLEKIYLAVEPGGQFYLQDFFLDSTMASPAPSAVFAINMLVNTAEGRTYSFDEVTGWLKSVGFTDIAIEDTPPGADIISCVKPF